MVIQFSCSDDAKTNITHAIQCIPLLELEGMNILFVCIDNSDARRLVMENYKEFEIIVISEFVVPRNWRIEDDWTKRYFNFVILHEVAHALQKHKSPNQLTANEHENQEADADAKAMEWLNSYFEFKRMALFTSEELELSQTRVRAERSKYL
jgi:hypothetical protein